jgi:hypothetical protein
MLKIAHLLQSGARHDHRAAKVVLRPPQHKDFA